MWWRWFYGGDKAISNTWIEQRPQNMLIQYWLGPSLIWQIYIFLKQSVSLQALKCLDTLTSKIQPKIKFWSTLLSANCPMMVLPCPSLSTSVAGFRQSRDVSVCRIRNVFQVFHNCHVFVSCCTCLFEIHVDTIFVKNVTTWTWLISRKRQEMFGCQSSSIPTSTYGTNWLLISD